MVQDAVSISGGSRSERDGRLGGAKYYSRAAAQSLIATHESDMDVVSAEGGDDSKATLTIVPEPWISRLTLCSPTTAVEVVVWDGAMATTGEEMEQEEGEEEDGGPEWEELCELVREVKALRIIAPLSLGRASSQSICLTLDQLGLVAVHLGR